MDEFFDLFIAEVRKKLPKYLKSWDSEVQQLTVPNRPIKPRGGQAKAGGVDGGVGVVNLANGHQVLLARAAAVGPNFVEREFVVDVATVDSNSLKWTYLITVEALAGYRAVTRSGVDILFMDGSLYAKTMRLVHNLILTREFQNLYYVPEFAAALHALAKLIEVAQERGVKLVFVSKDNNFKLLKEHLLFEKLYERHRDPLFHRGTLWHSILWIRKFRKELLEFYKRHKWDYQTSQTLELVIRQSVTDSQLLKRWLPPGHYTVPMVVGGCDAYLNYKNLNSVEKLAAAAADRLEDASIFRLRESRQTVVEVVRDALRGLPKVYFFYVKLGDDNPLLVEMPAVGTKMFDNTPLKAFYPSADVDDVTSALRQYYKNSIHYNTWLWYAHSIASLKSSQLKEYSVYISKFLNGVGVARRVKMWSGL